MDTPALFDFLNRYGRLDFTSNQRYTDIAMYGDRAFMCMPDEIKMTLDFHGRTEYIRFVEFLDNAKNDYNIRSQNEAVQRAYEEYQILLKLSK